MTISFRYPPHPRCSLGLAVAFVRHFWRKQLSPQDPSVVDVPLNLVGPENPEPCTVYTYCIIYNGNERRSQVRKTLKKSWDTVLWGLSMEDLVIVTGYKDTSRVLLFVD